MSYTVLDENMQVKGRLSLNNGRGNTTFFGDTITTQLATDNANDPTNLTTNDYTNQDKQGNAKQWSHSLTISFESTDLGTSITTNDYLMYFDDVVNHYYLMKVLGSDTDRSSGYITATAINAAIYELGKQLIQTEQTLSQVDLKTFVTKMYKNAPFSLQIADNNLTTVDYTISANTSLQALLQDLQTKFNVDVDSWVEVDNTGHITDRVLYFGNRGRDNGELIRYGGAKGFEAMTATEVSDIIYTKLYVTGKTDDKDTTKGHIGTVNNGLEYIVDDEANQKLYAIGASQQQPVYLEGAITNNLLSEPQSLLDWAKEQMAIFNHPRFNYTVTPLHDQNVALGDIITVQDFHIKPMILVNSKVIQKTTSFANPETNSFVLGEFSSIFTDNMNKGANVINLIKKDVTVVQAAADIAKAQADAAYQQAVTAQEKAIHAQTSADDKTTSYTVDSVQDLPKSANEGDIGWVKLSDGTHMYSYTDGEWVEKINPSMGADIDKKVSDAVSQAKSHTDEVKQGLSRDIATAKAQVKSQADTAQQNAIAQAQTDAQALVNDSSNTLNGKITTVKNNVDNLTGVVDSKVSQTTYDSNKQITDTNISELQQRADGFNLTVAKVDNFSVGLKNLVRKWSGQNASDTIRPYINDVANTSVYNTKGNIYISDGLFLQINDPKSEMYYSLVNAWTPLSQLPMLEAGETYTIGMDVTGSFDYVAFRISDAWYTPKPINHTKFERVYQQFTIPTDATQFYLRINASKNVAGEANFYDNQAMVIRNIALYKSTVKSDGAPAPEDIELALAQVKVTADGINNFVRDSSGNISSDFQTALSKTSIITGSTLATSIRKQTATQISSALTDNNGKIISLINQDSSGVQIAGKNIVLDGNTTVTGTFKVSQANIANGAIGTAQIGDAAITSAKIANLDVSKLTGDTITGFNINANRQIYIAPGGELKSSVVNMGANSFDVVAQNINSSRISSEGFKVSEVNGTFNISSGSGHVSSSGTISVNSPGQSSSYKTGNFSSEYNGNNILIYTTDYNNGDPDEFLNISSAQFDISHTKTGLLSDATDYTKIRANLIETTGTLNAFSGAQIPSIYSYPNLTLESKNQSVLLKAGGNVILQVRENGYMYMLTRHAGSGGRSLQIADDGGIFFASSSSKYKTDIQYDGSTSVGDKFLTLDPVTWQDKGDYEQRKLYRENGTEPDHQIYMDDKRYYGLIAEDLVKAGLEEFVVRDSRTGEVEGLEYDKVAISLIPVVREQRTAINELKVEIERLKDKVK